MSNSLCFLLIHNQPNQHWVQIIQEALSALGEVQLKEEKEGYNLINLKDYDLILIDAAIEGPLPQLIRHLHAHSPQARLIVMTASPTWRRAREVFRAGAIDYVRKSLDKEEILATVQHALAKKLQRRPSPPSPLSQLWERGDLPDLPPKHVPTQEGSGDAAAVRE